MLVALRISHLGLVDELALEVGPGLTVLTGETGAGKSMIAGALSLLAGAPVPKELVREGEDEAWVEGVFDLSGKPGLLERLHGVGVVPAGDGILVLRREIRRAGRNRFLINGMLSSLQILHEIGPRLLSVQSQDEQRELERPGHARDLLDALLDGDALRTNVREAWRSWRETTDALASRRSEVAAGLEQLEMWRYQRDELAAAALEAEEPAALTETLAVARNAAQMQAAAAAALEALDAEEGGVRLSLGRALHELERQAPHSTRLAEIAAQLRDAEAQCSEAASQLERFLDALGLDGRSRDELEERLALYGELQRKYRRDVPGLLALLDGLEERIERQERSGDDLSALEKAHAVACDELAAAASALRERRRSGERKVAARAVEWIRPLALPHLELRFEVSPRLDPDGPLAVDGATCRVGADGADDVTLIVRPNPGEREGPVAAIASGGERSRIHLGLTALARRDADPPLQLFDEIDAGLGMDGARPVAELLRSLARDSQVICITHLPTLAVHGAAHWRARKRVDEGRTLLDVEVLDAARRPAEVARLLGGEGAGGDPEARAAYARELLRDAGAAPDRERAAGNGG